MSVNVVSAVLICRTGELAGVRFELAGEATIGLDARNRVAAAADAQALAKWYARVFQRDGVYYLENLGAAGSVKLDEQPVSRPAALDRRHVVSVGGVDFVFSRVTAPTPALSRDSVPSSPHSTPVSTPVATPVAPPAIMATMHERGGYGSLPELKPNTGPTERAPQHSGPPLNTGPSAAPVASGGSGTVVDMGGFGVLPNLPKRGGAAPPPQVAPDPLPNAYTPPAAAVAPAAPTEAFVPPVEHPPVELTTSLPDFGPVTFAVKYGDNTIGRAQDCEIRVPDSKNWLSRRHATLRVSRTQIELIDLQGMNGTFVNGERITTVIIRPGSSFFLGPHLEFTLRKR